MNHGAMQGGSGGSMPGMDHGGMPGMGSGASPGQNQGMFAALNGGLQQGPQAKVLQGGEDMPNEGPTLENAMPDPLVNRTGAPPGAKVLSYRDLKALKPYPYKPYDRIIEMRLTGNMQRYIWSINGRKFSEAQPIVLRYGERARFRLSAVSALETV